jgi:glycine/D-amino acid oxidase-like deaminating enzyme/nitrite reductase/ring-hydroxylating ferredoxin subunit
MQSDLLKPHSLWSATAALPACPPLSAHLNVEVCVIGAGIAGLTTAYLLARSGVSVAVIEALSIGDGETSHTTAHIAIPDDSYKAIEDAYDVDVSRIVAESFAAAIDLIEANVKTEQIACEFKRVDGYLFSCAQDPNAALDSELEAARRAGVDAIKERTLPMEASVQGPFLRFPRQAQFHPLQYIGGLARAVERKRGAIHCGTRALEVRERDDHVVVTTPTGKITADAAVVATNTPFNDRVSIHVKQSAYQTYVVAALVKRGRLPHLLLWDDADPYHYVRLAECPDGEHDVLIVGGADHKTGQEPHPEEHYRHLESWMRERFPQAGALAYRWSGEVLEPLDGLAYLGRNPGSRNVYVITGDSGNGMTHATIGATLVHDLILERPNPWSSVYDPSRKSLKQAMRFFKGQANVAKQYTDWVSGGEEVSVAALSPGEGALVRNGLKKFAVYRDELGALHCHSATCTHLGCVVQWNSTEKTWDCPCHGSRYSAYGSVLHGPAVSSLAAADEEEWRGLVKEQPRRSTHAEVESRKG